MSVVKQPDASNRWGIIGDERKRSLIRFGNQFPDKTFSLIGLHHAIPVQALLNIEAEMLTWLLEIFPSWLLQWLFV